MSRLNSVSVLIPTYSRPALLDRAIQSALSQQHQGIEIVVGDDGGASDDVIARYREHVRHLRNEPRLGLPGNINRLGNEARGEFLAFMMDDDYWLPGFLSASMNAFASDPELGIVFTNHFVENGERTLRECQLRPGRHDRFAAELVRYNPVPLSASLIRRRVWQDVSPLPDTTACDFVLWARAAERGYPFFYVDEPLMAYKANATGLSASREFRAEVVKALESLRFSDAEAQTLLRKRLIRARYSRAKGNLAEGRPLAAVTDLARAVAGAGRAWLGSP